jgi:hypothetical protein
LKCYEEIKVLQIQPLAFISSFILGCKIYSRAMQSFI